MPSNPHCLFCHSNKFSNRQILTPPGFSLIRCQNCELTRTFPFPAKNQLYNNHYSSYRSPVNGQRFVLFLNQLIRLWRNIRVKKLYDLADHGAVIDVGCGQATELQVLKKRGLTVLGTEFSTAYAKSITLHTGVPVKSGDLSHLRLKPNSYSLITFFHSLEHLPDPVTAIKTSQKLLLPQGHLIISVPNISSLEARIFGRYWFHLDVPRHLFHFSENWLVALLTQQGFRVENISHTAPEYDFYSFWQSLLNYLFPQTPNLLYKSLLREQTISPQERTSLLLQSPLILITGLISIPTTLLLWLLNSAGTIQVTAVKNSP